MKNCVHVYPRKLSTTQILTQILELRLRDIDDLSSLPKTEFKTMYIEYLSNVRVI